MRFRFAMFLLGEWDDLGRAPQSSCNPGGCGVFDDPDASNDSGAQDVQSPKWQCRGDCMRLLDPNGLGWETGS